MTVQPQALEQRRKSLLAGGSLFLTVLFWGSMVPLTAVLLRTFDPYLLAVSRYVIGLPFLWLLVVLWREPGDWRLARPGRVLSLGAAMAAFSVLYTVGIQFSHPVTASVILTCGPIVASIMAKVLYRTPLDRALLVALPVTVGGAIVVAVGAPGRSIDQAGFGGGEILLVIAQVCWNWYSMKAQQWLSGMGQLRMSAVTTSVASLWLILLYVVLRAGGWAVAPPTDPSTESLLLLAWIGFSGVALSIVLWNTAVSLIGVPLSSIYMNLQPVIAAITAAVLGSPPTIMQVIGGCVVVAGVLYVQLSKMRAGAARG
ncbi:MAG: DMT family transporter [Rhodospirillales bacterium]